MKGFWKWLIGVLLVGEGLLAEVPLFVLGGGYWAAGGRHSGCVLQGEYRFGSCYCNYFRPQAVVIVANFESCFAGLGVGIDAHLGRSFVVTPSFTPGLYYQGSGKDLGLPLEFRSALEIAYQACNGARVGLQAYHISNASLSNKNPGVNAAVLILAVPLQP